MVKSRIKVVLDTNVLISAIVFGGIPKKVLNLILKEKFVGVTSISLMAELSEVIHKKFSFRKSDLDYLEDQILNDFEIIKPRKVLRAVRDDDDNRVLEAAVEGGCEFIITGDEDLLVLKTFGEIKIMTPTKFLKEVII